MPTSDFSRPLIKRLLLAAVVASSIAGFAGEAFAQPPYPPLPPPRYEVVPPPRGPRFIWEPGHWQWTGVQYAWVPGRYIARRPHYAQYAPGHWEARRGAWVWVPAHWR